MPHTFHLYLINLNSDWYIQSTRNAPFLISPSLSANKASRSNPGPIFSNCMQNDVTSVRRCLTRFCKENNCILLAFGSGRLDFEPRLYQVLNIVLFFQLGISLLTYEQLQSEEMKEKMRAKQFTIDPA